MKVGINTLPIIPDGMGGAETYIYNLISEIVPLHSNCEFILFISETNNSIFSFLSDKSHLVMIPGDMTNRAYRIFAENIFLPKLAKQHGIDVLFSPNSVLPVSLPCKSVVVIQNLDYFHWLDFNQGLKRNRLFYRYAQWLYFSINMFYSVRKAARVIAVSKNTQREITRYLKIPSKKISVVYHGVRDIFHPMNPLEIESFQSDKLISKLPKKFILYIGSLLPYKNIHHLISSYHLMTTGSDNVEHKLVIVGKDWTGYGRSLRQLANRLNLEDKVLFLGYVPHKSLPLLYNLADVLVLISSCESFGLPLIEAMACGTPVIASNVSSLPEIVGDAGILVNPFNHEALAETLRLILNNECLKKQLFRKGLARAAGFNWRATASKVYEVLVEALNG